MPNYSRAFSEAVVDTMRSFRRFGNREHARQNPETIHAGYWLVKATKNSSELPAKIWIVDHEPGNPCNKVDQPYYAAEIAGEQVDPLDVFSAAEKRELVAEGNLTLENEYQYRIKLLRWADEHSPNDPAAPRRRIDLTRLDPIGPPPGPGDNR